MAFDKRKAKKIAKATAVHSGRTVSSVVGLAFKIVGTVILLALTTGAVFSMVFALYIRTTLEPQIEGVSLEAFSLGLTSTISEFDHETQQWREAVPLESGQVRHWVPYDEINPHLINAAVAFEDRRFHEHRGVDWYRTVAAFHTMFLGDGDGQMFGASTITQQLIKNLFQEDDVTVRRKIVEIFRAMELERVYTKEEILEWYLNIFALGGRISGVGAAAQFYYGVDQSELTIAQSASIVGITQFPSRFNPFLNLEANQGKRDEVLGVMYNQGFITYAEFNEAINEEIVLNTASGGATFVAAIYTFYQETIINDLLLYFQEEWELTAQAARTMVFYGGLDIRSAVDNRMQTVVDEAFSTTDNLPIPAGAEAAMIIMDQRTGHILAMGGRVGEKTNNIVLNFATTARRPPGSSIKPISVYGPAMEMGIIRPNDMVLDAPVMDQGRPWPRNAHGSFSNANQNIVRAVSASTNTVAVRVLEMMGVTPAYDFMKNRLHIDLDPADEDRAPLALGQLTHGLTVREITAAYAAFANHGIFTHPVTVAQVFDANGELIIDNINRPRQEPVYRAEVAGQMTAMLVDAVVNGTGGSARISGFDVAGKTGSTDRWRDRWFAGYTPHVTASVWAGFEEMHAGSLPGNNPAAIIFSRVVRDAQAAAGMEPARFENLPSLSASFEAADHLQICIDSGLLATEACNAYIGGMRSTFFSGAPEDAPTESCGVHVPITVCTATNLIPNTTCQTHVRGFGVGVTPEGCGEAHQHGGVGDGGEGPEQPGEGETPVEPTPQLPPDPPPIDRPELPPPPPPPPPELPPIERPEPPPPPPPEPPVETQEEAEMHPFRDPLSPSAVPVGGATNNTLPQAEQAEPPREVFRRIRATITGRSA